MPITEGIDPNFDHELSNLRAFAMEVETITAAAEKVILPAVGGGRPASGLRAARLALRKALDILNQ